MSPWAVCPRCRNFGVLIGKDGRPIPPGGLPVMAGQLPPFKPDSRGYFVIRGNNGQAIPVTRVKCGCPVSLTLGSWVQAWRDGHCLTGVPQR
jgi:hypothetical protein